jgi:hypothetical protein
VLLALIGPDWLRAVDGTGGWRLAKEDDLVRVEIATALDMACRRTRRRFPTGDCSAGRSRRRDFRVIVSPRQCAERQEINMALQPAKTQLSVLTLYAALAFPLAAPLAAHAQAAPPASPASAASAAEKGNKAGKPPVDAAASQSNVANKKPAKPGAQAGPSSAPQK